MHTQSPIRRAAFLADYLPRKCGIATFTNDLYLGVVGQYPEVQCSVVAVNDIEGGYDYPDEVRFEIQEQDVRSYQRAADFLNISNVDLVCLQHEFGVYGGAAGSHLLALLRDLNMPVVTTFHTVLEHPNPDQSRVMRELIQLSTRLVVMTERARNWLQEIYQAPEERIDLIPHGIPDMPFADPSFFKEQFGVQGKRVLLTFGLLSPNKGIEFVLNALPKILEEFPDVVYIVLGATHPNLVREQGEAYRLSLERLAKDNNVQKNVIFYNRFVELEELKEFIAATDIYVTPYLNEAQITSGTLAYSFGSGKVVVSTPYWHASELLADGRGVLVPFGDSPAIAREVSTLLRDEPRCQAMRKQAYLMGREMIWSNVAHSYMRSFDRARTERATQGRTVFATRTLDQQLNELPEIKLDHLFTSGDISGFREMAEQALINNPNDTDVLAHFGLRLALIGDWDRGLPLLKRAVALNPAYPSWYRFAWVFYHYERREYETALEEINKINMPGFFWTHIMRAAILAQLGRVEEATAAVSQLLSLDDNFRNEGRAFINVWQFPEPLSMAIIEGLEKAGLHLVDEQTR